MCYYVDALFLNDTFSLLYTTTSNYCKELGDLKMVFDVLVPAGMLEYVPK